MMSLFSFRVTVGAFRLGLGHRNIFVLNIPTSKYYLPTFLLIKVKKSTPHAILMDFEPDLEPASSFTLNTGFGNAQCPETRQVQAPSSTNLGMVINPCSYPSLESTHENNAKYLTPLKIALITLNVESHLLILFSFSDTTDTSWRSFLASSSLSARRWFCQLPERNVRGMVSSKCSS